MQRLLRVRRPWVGCAALLMSLAALTACGATSSNGGNAQHGAGVAAGAGGTTPPPAGQASGGGQGGSSMACQSAAKVTITEKAAPGQADRYAFSPAAITLQRGGLLSIQNRSDEIHALDANPDAGIVTTVVMKKERQFVQFPQAGTFTLRSADAAHRATLQVTVSGDTGCGAPKQTLTITETKAGGADVYSFSPRTLTVDAGENVTVVNKSDENQTFKCTPDPGNNAYNTTVAKTESQIIALDKQGRYSCATGKKAKVTITVNGM